MKRHDLANYASTECKELEKEEKKFWETLVSKYLKPLDHNEDEKYKIEKKLLALRNNIALGTAMINILWIAINFMFQLASPTTIQLTIAGSSDDPPDSPDYLKESQGDNTTAESANNIIKVDVLGLLFIFLFLAILLVQFIGMIIHRWGTLQHLVSVTKLSNPRSKAGKKDNKDKDIKSRTGRKIIQILLENDDDDDDRTEDEELEKNLKVIQRTGSRKQVKAKSYSAKWQPLNEIISDSGRLELVLQSKEREINASEYNRNVKRNWLNFQAEGAEIEKRLPPGNHETNCEDSNYEDGPDSKMSAGMMDRRLRRRIRRLKLESKTESQPQRAKSGPHDSSTEP